MIIIFLILSEIFSHFIWNFFSFYLKFFLILSEIFSHLIWNFSHFIWNFFSFYLKFFLILLEIFSHFMWDDLYVFVSDNAKFIQVKRLQIIWSKGNYFNYYRSLFSFLKSMRKDDWMCEGKNTLLDGKLKVIRNMIRFIIEF